MHRVNQMKRRIIFIALVVTVLGWVGWLMLNGLKEPVYHGKRLSEWLDGCPGMVDALDGNKNGDMTGQQELEDAIKAAGTNGIPVYLRLLRERDSAWKLKLAALLQKQHWIKFRFISAARRNLEGDLAFQLLGARAGGAASELVKIYRENVSVDSRGATVDALGDIYAPAQVAVPALILFLGDADAEIRKEAALFLGHYGEDARPAIPALIRILEGDGYEEARAYAAIALGRAGGDSAAARRTLARAASADPEANVRSWAAKSLREIEAEGVGN